MDSKSCSYVQINNCEISVVTKWKYIYRQIFVSSAIWSTFFSFGLMIGTPTIYIAQMERANSSEIISNEMASWISSTSNYSSMPFLFLMTALSNYLGRKKSFLLGCVTSFIGFTTMYFSDSVKEVLVGEFFLGGLIACDFIICGLVLNEYTSPQYRGVFLMVKSSTLAWGILVANTMGLYIAWTYIPLLGCMCAIYSFLVGLLWPESPYWLAGNQDYSACTDSHYWLKGKSKDSIEELKSLIKTHQNFFQNKTERPQQNKVIKVSRIVTSKQFYRPVLYATLLTCVYHFFGKMVCNVYVIQLIKSVVQNETVTHYGTIIIDVVSVFGMYLASIVTRFFKRKLMLLVSSLISIGFLFMLSIYLYLVKLEMVNEDKYTFLIMLSLYIVVVSVGPIILIPSIETELCPLRLRGVYMLLQGLLGNIVMGTVIKCTPLLVSFGGLHGAFLFFGIVSLILSSLIYIIIPETKDKNIFEISNAMR